MWFNKPPGSAVVEITKFKLDRVGPSKMWSKFEGGQRFTNEDKKFKGWSFNWFNKTARGLVGVEKKKFEGTKSVNPTIQKKSKISLLKYFKISCLKLFLIEKKFLKKNLEKKI